MSYTILQMIRYLGLFVVIGTAYSVTARIIPDHRTRPAAALVVGILVVTPLLFGLLFADYELRRRAARETLASTAIVNPLFIAIAAYSPDAYETILDEAAEITVAGAGTNAVQQKIRPLVVKVVRNAYLDSSDEQRIGFERANLAVIRSAVASQPGSCSLLCRCWQLPYADQIECMDELTRTAAPELKRKRDRMTIELVRNAKRHPGLARKMPVPNSADAVSERFASAFLKRLELNDCCGNPKCCLEQLQMFAALLDGPAEQIFTAFRQLDTIE